MADIADLIARPPAFDFRTLADPFQGYMQGRDMRSQLAAQDALKQGIPRNPDGTLNFGAMVDQMARSGNMDAFKTAVALSSAEADRSLNRTYKLGMLDVAKQQANRKETPEKLQLLTAAGIAPGTPQAREALFPKTEKPFNPTEMKGILDAEKSVEAANNVISALDHAKQLSAKAMGGPMAGTRGYIGSLVGNEAGLATEELTNLITTNALENLRATFGGNPTEGERKVMLEVQGSVNKPHAVREKIYERAQEMARKRVQFNQSVADRLRSREFFKPAGAQAPATTVPQAGAPRQLPAGTTPQQVLQEAQAAIAKGAPREAVMQRLRELGINLPGQ